jgi:hypothetical protein
MYALARAHPSLEEPGTCVVSIHSVLRKWGIWFRGTKVQRFALFGSEERKNKDLHCTVGVRMSKSIVCLRPITVIEAARLRGPKARSTPHHQHKEIPCRISRHSYPAGSLRGSLPRSTMHPATRHGSIFYSNFALNQPDPHQALA